MAEGNNLFWATTSATSKYATTSVTALAEGFAMGTGEWNYTFSKNVATSSNTTIDSSAPLNVLEGRNNNGSSNYILAAGESITGIIATSTAGTFVTYDSGVCSAVIRKL